MTLHKKNRRYISSDLFFKFILNRSLIYNTSWEDPRIDREYLEIGENDNIATITSAGCNVLDYLLDEPYQIHTCDINCRQNAIIELKIALIKHTDHKTLFNVFGKGKFDCFKSLYFDFLRQFLSEKSRLFWDKHHAWFIDEKGFYYHGSTGYFASKINKLIDKNHELKKDIAALFNSDSFENQIEIYNKIESELWQKNIVKLIDNRYVLSILGIPLNQRNKIHAEYENGLADFLKQRIRKVFTLIPANENYFWYLYFTGNYTVNICPEYLKESNFEKLQQNVDKITIHDTDYKTMLNKFDNYFDKFALLDHQDWLSEAKIKDEWKAVINSSKNNSKFILRSASFNKNMNYGNINYNYSISDSLHQHDRVGTYAGLYCGKILC